MSNSANTRKALPFRRAFSALALSAVAIASSIGAAAPASAAVTTCAKSSGLTYGTSDGLTAAVTGTNSGLVSSSVTISSLLSTCGNYKNVAVTTIADYALGTKNLTSVTIPSSVGYIGNFAFASNALTSVTIPSSVTYIGTNAFANNNLRSVSIPSSVTYIGTNAFANNFNLVNAAFSGNAPMAGEAVFYNTGVNYVQVQEGTTGWTSFWGGYPVYVVPLYPGAPTIQYVNPGNGRLSIYFTAPTSNGSAQITGYQYSLDGGANWVTLYAPSSPLVVQGLTNGTEYSVKLRAFNIAGPGTPSAAVLATPRTTPGAPTIESVTAGNGQLSINFTAPTSNGGAPITSYQYSLDGGSHWVARSTTSSPIVVTGLTNGTAYSVKLGAINSAGAGTLSAAVSATPVTTPDAPTVDSVVAGNGQLAINFTAPTSNGGSAITDYLVEYKESLVLSWSTFSHDVSASTLSYTISGLTNGTSYDVRVSGVNAVGTGSASSTSSVTPAPTAPDAPAVDTVVAGDSQVTINFSAPATDGGSTITSYEYSLDNGFTWVVAGMAASPLVITGLTNGTAYSVKLRAVNSIGAGSANAAVSVTPTMSADGFTFRVDAEENAAVTGCVGSCPADLVIPSTLAGHPVTEIATEAFILRSLTSVSLPATLITIADGAFGNNSLTDVAIPSSVTTLGAFAFNSNLLTHISIPASVTSVGYAAFNANGLTSVNFLGNAPLDAGDVFNSNSGLSAIDVQYGTSGWGATWSGIPVNVVGAPTVPGAPAVDSVTAGDSQLNVNFSAPATDGGSSITNYLVEYKATSDSSWTTFSHDASVSTLSYTITGLTNGTSYDVRISAVNAVGTGSASSVSSRTPATTPDAPTVDSVVAGDGQLTINFSLIAFYDGGSPVTSYEYSLDDGFNWVSFGATSSPIVVTGLTNGTSYSVKLRAVNSIGAGSANSAVVATPVAPVIVPGAPIVDSLTAGDGQLTINFTAPASDGGSVVTNYQYSLDDGFSWVAADTTSSPIVVSGLTNGTSYSVKLRAVNTVGAGSANDAVAATPVTTPGAPTIDSVVPGDGQLSINFTAPASDGGVLLAGYEYSLDGGASWNPSYSFGSIVVTGLTNGTEYFVQVRAVNGLGAGPSSKAFASTPVTTPGAPTIDSVVPGDGQLSIYFTAPASDGGSVVTSYEYSVNDGLDWVAADTTSSPIVVTGLNNGTAYSVKLRAVNALEAGASSEAVAATPVTTPGAPTIDSVVPGDGQLSINFTAPASDGGSAITRYVVEYKASSDSSWTEVNLIDAMPFTILGLTNGTSYDVRVSAVNSVGSGPSSKAFAATPVTTPGAPIVHSVVAGDGQVAINFYAPVSDGGSSITAYEYSLDNGFTWVTASGPVTGQILVTGLINSTTYSVKLRAVNTVGTGSANGAVDATPVAPVVPTPTETASPTDTPAVEPTPSVEPTPESTPTVTPTVEPTPSVTPTVEPTPSVTPTVEPTPSVTPTVEPTPSVTPTPTPTPTLTGKPASAPRIVTANLGNGQVTLGIWAPIRNGGTSITGYQYTVDGGTTWAAVDAASTASSLLITGLQNGTKYAVKIRALNGAGGGTASAGRSVTPRATASAPVITSLAASSSKIMVTFDVPSNDGGSTVTRYGYSIDGGAWKSLVGTGTLRWIRGLKNGVSYSIRIRALNGAGWSEASNAVEATPHK